MEFEPAIVHASYEAVLDFFETQLNPQTVALIEACEIVCVFVNDIVNETVIKQLAEKNVKIIGHHETGGNTIKYESQIDSAFTFYNKYGINIVKTGYVGGLLDGKAITEASLLSMTRVFFLGSSSSALLQLSFLVFLKC